MIQSMLAFVFVLLSTLTPPEKLTTELIVGTWRMDWGPEYKEGYCTFNTDGTYELRINQNAPHTSWGWWKLDGKNLTWKETHRITFKGQLYDDIRLEPFTLVPNLSKWPAWSVQPYKPEVNPRVVTFSNRKR